MAHYVRFEIYLPVVFFTNVSDPRTGESRRVRHSMDEVLVSQFIAETCGRYHGVTQVNPISPAPYKGWWKEKADSPLDIDFLTHLFGLVKVDEGDEALEFFTEWKTRIEDAENQKYILVIFYPVQTIGDFF